MKKENSALIDMHNKVSTQEVEEIINLQLDALFADPNCAKTMPPLLIHGSPGLGKSTIIRNICEKRGIECISLSLSQIEPCDIRGLPVPDKENKCMNWFVNGMWPRNPNGKGIIFLDEIMSCDKSCQVAAYELVLERRLGMLYSVPPGYLIVAAGNLVTDNAVAYSMSSALANRFMHVELEADADDWLEWARANDIHPSVTGFIQYKREMLFQLENQNRERGWPSPRSWERVSQMCKLCKNEKMLRHMVYGLVGNGAGVEFMTFHKINAEFDDILEMMTNPKAEIKIPAEADRKYAMCASLAYLVWKGKDAKDLENRINGFLRICIELTSDFAVMAMIAAKETAGKDKVKTLIPLMSKNPLFAKWTQKHIAEIKKNKKASFAL